MIDLFACPAPTVIPDFSNPDCNASYGNVIGLAFQLKQASAPFTNAAAIQTQSNWTTLLSAVAGTKIVVVPVVSFGITPGEIITEGGNDGTTYLNIPKVKGLGYSTVNYVLEGFTPAAAKEVTVLSSLARIRGGRSNLTVYLLTDENHVHSLPDFKGIPVFGQILRDLEKAVAYKPEERYAGQFYLPETWSFDTVYTKVNFEVADLANA